MVERQLLMFDQSWPKRQVKLIARFFHPTMCFETLIITTTTTTPLFKNVLLPPEIVGRETGVNVRPKLAKSTSEADCETFQPTMCLATTTTFKNVLLPPDIVGKEIAVNVRSKLVKKTSEADCEIYHQTMCFETLRTTTTTATTPMFKNVLLPPEIVGKETAVNVRPKLAKKTSEADYETFQANVPFETLVINTKTTTTPTFKNMLLPLDFWQRDSC